MPGEAKPSLLDAITAGIEEANTGVTPVAAAVESDDTDTSTETTAESSTETTDDGSQSNSDESAGASEEGKSTDDASAAGDESKTEPDGEGGEMRARGPDGKFLPKAKTEEEKAKEAAAAALTPEQKKAEEEKAKKKAEVEAAAKDPVNAPIPKDLKKETQERMRTLVTKVKEADTKVTQLQQNLDVVFKPINESKATPEQFGAAFQLIKLMNSDKVEDQREALKLLQKEVVNMSKLTGTPVAGVDLLSEHADLRAEVQAGVITQKRAEEIAAFRESQKAHGEIKQNTTAAETAKKAGDDARAGLTALEAELKSDPDYWQKRQILIPAMQEAFQTLHPSKWVSTFKASYARIKLPPKAAVAAPTNTGATGGTPAAKPNNQPLRGKVGASGAAESKAPKSMLDAINFGIATAGK